MKTVKQLLFAALIGLLMVSVAMAQEKASQTAEPGPTTTYQAKFPITIQGGEYDMKTVIIDFPQGVGMPTHMHGGHVLVIVLNGEMTLKEKGTERIIKAGESWTENPGNHHSVVNAGSTTARVVVNMLLPKGAEATTIIK
ncbi:MAG: cupin domain-containing protein [Nitrospirae bacterium]|nr:cupin domain-containing protein [Nitrospirota bacterium]